MGKGDQKTRIGKISMGSYGISRPRLSGKLTVPKKVVEPTVES
ncbi:30S ribosomal protein THX [Spirosoma sp. HMF3257]|uniref:30S ribosomal protein THX n=1 Tax=Spirosoma telluris TaxID=2183553 RepID=A0A327NGX3_9BACT|nr:30S ribosomal protein THX [Spirosoma telluris]RAI74075.1 30S ribosomal protein THX [Spirosoma telluris]